MSIFGNSEHSPRGKVDIRTHVSLSKATYIELFFDLVFIFCTRSILPIITGEAGADVGWYPYYTFWFTFALMLQIWFNSTIFMNRFGTGRTPDIIYLFTTMLLLFVMTQAISTTWENYAVYNVCWILVTVNTMIHWVYRYRRMANPTPRIKRDTRLALGTLGAQALLVAFSHLLPKTPAQVICLAALLLGYLFWYAGGKDELDQSNRKHLKERCALLMVLTFGETLVGFGYRVTTGLNYVATPLYFLLIVGMFLVYLNEIANLLDLGSLHGGRRYMAISAWLTFCVANVTAGFDMSIEGTHLMGMSGDVYFGISVAVFLLSFFMFTPFNKYKRPSVKWTAARIIACLLVLAQSSISAAAAQHLLSHTPLDAAGISSSAAFANAAMLIPVVAVFAILTIDRIALRRERRKAAAENERQGE